MRSRRLLPLAAIALPLLAAAADDGFRLSSPSFEDGGVLPARFTCDAENRSPALVWTAPPAGTRSLLLAVLDPDAPDPDWPLRTWVHWVVADLPPLKGGLYEGAAQLPERAVAGTNDSGGLGWTGPCPPVGVHRYQFHLFALDTLLRPQAPPDWRELWPAALPGHVIAESRLTGLYGEGAGR